MLLKAGTKVRSTIDPRWLGTVVGTALLDDSRNRCEKDPFVMRPVYLVGHEGVWLLRPVSDSVDDAPYNGLYSTITACDPDSVEPALPHYHQGHSAYDDVAECYCLTPEVKR